MQSTKTRRRFLSTLSSLGAASLVGARSSFAQEAPPETTTVRLIKGRSICWAPQYIAEELLRMEGFTEILYVDDPAGVVSKPLAAGQADLSMNFVGPNIIQVEAGDPVVFLAGVHVGCFEVFGGERVKKISDIKGKTVAIQALNGAEHVFLASIAAHVGLDPGKDIKWATHAPGESTRLFAEGKVDAIIGFPPQPQELRAKGIGRVILNSALDRPWSQYFCCLLTANREFVRKYPIATKRALRGILKAADLCVSNPAGAARRSVDRGFTPNYAYALQTLQEVPYNKWRDYDPEDTLRFYALRLHEAGMIKLTPGKLIAEATDWRFLAELKRELRS
jgi:NitT/TauT family transport system substrate-binding protein